MSPRRIATLIATAALVLAGCGNPPPADGGAKPSFLFEPRPVPDVEMTSLDGEPIRPASMGGTVRMVDFWATWCAPCIAAIPHYKAFHEKYADRGFVLIGVSMDVEGEAVVRPFVEKMAIPYPIVLGDDALADAFGGLPGYPTVFLVDRSGTVVQRFVGDVPPRILEQEIVSLLEEDPAGAIAAADGASR